MSQHEIRRIKAWTLAVLFYVLATVSAIVSGLPG